MTDRLAIGEKLERGQSLTSKNGAYTLTLQDDGNLVLAAQGQAVWATGTNGQDAERLEVQKDGNVVLYTSDKPIWHTDTKGAKDIRLILQDDRNVVRVRVRRRRMGVGHNTDEAPQPPMIGDAAAPEVVPPSAPRSRLPRQKNRCRPPRLRHHRRRLRLRHHHRRHRLLLAPTRWSPVTRCGRSPSASTVTAASTSESPTPAASVTPI